jgi:hypothetical protein
MHNSDDQQWLEDFKLVESEEMCFLDAALYECSKIHSELQASLDFAASLVGVKSPSSFTPGNSLPTPEGDVVINEQCRKQCDLASPQQHHKVQEINDEFDFSDSSTTPSSSAIINHPTEVNEQREFSVDDKAGGDAKAFDRQTTSSTRSWGGVNPTDRYERLEMELMRLKNDFHRSIFEAQRQICDS